MKKKKLNVSVVKCMTFVLIFLCATFVADASELFHTIQTGSFTNVATAHKQYDSIVKKLSAKECDHLRIEKIGKFYSVRLGKYDNHQKAEEFLQTIKSTLSNVTVMKAYIKDERIVKMYADPSSTKKEKVESNVLPDSKPEKMKAQIAKKVDQNRSDASLNEDLKKIASFVDKKEFEAALDVLKAKIDQDPDNPHLNAWFGMVLLKMDKPTKALKYFVKATELSPRESDYHNGLGYCLFNLNMFGNAIEEFNKAISLDPEHVDSLTGLGIAYVKSGNKADAMKVYNKLNGLDKETSDKLLKIIERTM